MNDKQKDERNGLFDSAVREQMTGYEPQVPHALWNRIASELDNEAAGTTSTIIQQKKTTTGKWQYAIAAAILLTLTIGTLLYTLSPNNSVNTNAAPMADKTTKHAADSQPVVATTPIISAVATKTIAQSSPTVIKPIAKVITATPKTAIQNTVAAKETEPATIETNPTPAQNLTAQDMQLEFTPVATQNNPVEVGNIPLASLNFLSTPSSLNDEITVIKSQDTRKKKHGRKSEEESTRVIVLGKKFDSKPNIIYQIPVRF